MKNAIKALLIASFFCLLFNQSPCHASLYSCEERIFTFDELKYYDKNELLNAYCHCSFLYNNALSLIKAKGEELVESTKNLGPGNPIGRRLELEINELNHQFKTANENASRIQRVLKKDLKHKGPIKCNEKGQFQK